MIVLSRESLYARNRFEVRLEANELSMTDDQLINKADGSDYDGPSYHFGGCVNRRVVDSETFATIDVYID